MATDGKITFNELFDFSDVSSLQKLEKTIMGIYDKTYQLIGGLDNAVKSMRDGVIKASEELEAKQKAVNITTEKGKDDMLALAAAADKLTEANKKLDKMEADLTKAKIKAAAESQKQKKANEGSLASINQLIKEQTALRNSVVQGSAAYAKYEKSVIALTSQKNILIASEKEAIKIATLNKIITNSNETAYNKLKAQFDLNTISLDKMTLSERENTAEGRKLVEETNNIRTAMSNSKKAVGDHRLEVGNYKIAAEALNLKLANLRIEEKGIVTELNRAKIGFQQASKGTKGLTDTTIAQTNATAQASIGYKNQAQRLQEVQQQISNTKRELAAVKRNEAIDNIGASFKNMFGAMTLANIASSTFQKIISGVKDYLNEASAAFQEAETSAKNLEFAVREIAGGSKSAFKELMKQSNELSSNKNYSIFTDEQIQRAQSMGLELGLTLEQVKKLMPGLIDVASRSGDLEGSMQKVIRGTQGQAKGLKSLVGNIKLTKDATENFNIITEKLTKFQGGAAVALNTTSGALQKQKNDLEETQEALGKYTSKVEVWWEKAKGMVAKSIVVNIEAMSDAVSGFEESASKSTEKLNDHKQSVISVIEQYAKLTGQTREAVALNFETATSIKQANDGYNEMVKFINKTIEAKSADIQKTDEQIKAEEEAAQKRKEKLSELENLRIELITDAQQKEIAIENKRYKDYIDKWGQLKGAYELHMNKLKEIDKEYNDYVVTEEVKKKDIILELKKEELDEKLEANTTLTDAYIEQRNIEIDNFKELQQLKLEALNSFVNLASEIYSNNIDANISQLEKQRDFELELAGDNANKKEQIEKKFQRAIAAERRKQAVSDKSLAMFNIALSTAVAIMQALKTGLGAPAAILYGAIGAAQLAAVASKPIPAFKHGTKNAPEGFAQVSEAGQELWERNGKAILTPATPSIVYLKKGDKIHPAHSEQTKIYKNAYDSLGLATSANKEQLTLQSMQLAFTGAINKLPVNVLNWNDSGYQKHTKKSLESVKRINNRNTMGGQG